METRDLPRNLFGQYEVEVEGRTYMLYGLSAMTQLRVARLLGPTLLDLFKDGGARLFEALRGLQSSGAATESGDATSSGPAKLDLTETLMGAHPILVPLVESLHGLTDADMDGLAKAVLCGKGKGSGKTPKVRLDGRWVDAWDWNENEPADKDLTGVGLVSLVAASLMREFNRIRDRHLPDADAAA